MTAERTTRDPKSTRDGKIVWEAECHCFGCGQAALGLDRRDPQADLRDRGWRRINRRYRCGDCAENGDALLQL